jgi:predicted P-loop ATPase/GTPase
MRLLVAGGDRVDAGKTTFAVGLLASTPGEPVAVKPRAGNDYWFDHDDALAALSEGRLYGKDVTRLVETGSAPPNTHSDPTDTHPNTHSDSTDTHHNTHRGSTNASHPHERANPVHRLWRPTPGRTGMLGERGRTFLLDRVQTPEGASFVVNGNVDIPETVRESLPLESAARVTSVGEFNDVMRERHLPALRRLADRLRADGDDGARRSTPARDGDDHLVVESYADVADPLRGVDYDAVAVVDPGRCRVYGGHRWNVACAAADDAGGQLEERVDSVTGMIEPLATVSLPPLAAAERADPTAVADANAEAYERLFEAATEREQ